MDGIIIINKPKGCTSHDIVYKIKKICGEKVGHTGTLDPNATGVLPILVGNGTKLSKYLINHDKKYIATIKLGIKTDTGDTEGEIIETKKVPMINEQIIENALKKFIGKQAQTPPIYSAIKVKGKKLYEYARKGEQVQIPSREITIYSISLIKINNDELQIEVECSKGTYIRTLCEDISNELGTVGYMKELERTKVGQFVMEQAITINNDVTKQNIENNIISIEKFLKEYDCIELNNKELTQFLNGVKITKNVKNGIYKMYNNGKFLGTGIIEEEKLKRDIII